ncbi:MAG: topoisomerase C-terminal repeat-containing protein, partial [Lapillicoccus sp.]
AMEEKGIGRPSTYAQMVGTIQDRGYVQSRGTALVPTWLAFAVTRLLEEHFSNLVDYDFTASMEEDLDRIASGTEQRSDWLKRFYFGDEATSSEGLRDLVNDLGEIDAREISTIPLGDGMVVRVGRYGPYVEELVPQGVDGATGEVVDGVAVPDTPRRATINDDIAPDEMTPAKARELLEAAADDGRVLGTDPDSGREVVARAGRYGPYVSEVLPPELVDLKGKAKVKPRTASLFKDMDLATIELDTALKLMSLPRVVGTVTEEDGSSVEITAQNGRYGPYLKKGTDSRSLATEQQLFEVTLDEAVAIYAQPKLRGRAAVAPLKELGPDPVSGKPTVVKDGRFGAYVTDGETNATLRRDDDLETLTPERGFELLAEKRAKGPTTRKRAVKTTRKAAAKSTAKKTTAKKTTATKSAAKQTTKKA